MFVTLRNIPGLHAPLADSAIARDCRAAYRYVTDCEIRRAPVGLLGATHTQPISGMRSRNCRARNGLTEPGAPRGHPDPRSLPRARIAISFPKPAGVQGDAVVESIFHLMWHTNRRFWGGSTQLPHPSRPVRPAAACDSGPERGSGAERSRPRWHCLWILAWGRASREASPTNDRLLGPKPASGHGLQCLRGRIRGHSCRSSAYPAGCTKQRVSA